MSIRAVNPISAQVWNEQITSNPDGGNVFQSYEFSLLKANAGWTIRYITVQHMSLTILEKNIVGLGAFWYIPKGPGITSVTQLQAVLPELRTYAQNAGVFAITIEPELRKTASTLTHLNQLGLKKVRPIQPNFSTVLIDLAPDLDTILARFNQKGRHAVKRAERDGVSVKLVKPTDENCQLFYRLLKDTAEGSFYIRSYDYYRMFWQTFATAKHGQLFFAYVQGQVVAGAFALILGTKSTYKDGASVRERTAYGASHLLQWHVIQWAKQHGALTHDLCGAPPSDQINNKQHPHYGIGRFKTSFNKEVTDYIGAYNVVIRPLRYRIWLRVGERIVQRRYFQIHHESWY